MAMASGDPTAAGATTPPEPPTESPTTRLEKFGSRYVGRERHMVPSWYEWALREFSRYWYIIGVLAVLVFVPIQMIYSWLPTGAPPVVSPLLVALAILGSEVLILAAAILGYLFLWKGGGWVDQAIVRHEEVRRTARRRSQTR